MSDNVPITVISEALGHKYANVTMQNVRLDIEKLRYGNGVGLVVVMFHSYRHLRQVMAWLPLIANDAT